MCKLPPMYTHKRRGDADGDPCNTAGRCVRCGKPLSTAPVSLELDTRTGEYHDFGDVPEQDSQGWFEFGGDCAEALRTRALAARTSMAAPQ